MAGLQVLRDLWEADSMNPLPSHILQNMYPLRNDDRPGIIRFLTSVPPEWQECFNRTRQQALEGDCVGFYSDACLSQPTLLLRATKVYCPALPLGRSLFAARAGQACYIVGP